MKELIKQIDEILELREQMIDKQRETGISCGVLNYVPLAFYSVDKFMALAELIKADVKVTDTGDVELPKRLTLEYEGERFNAYATKEKYEELSAGGKL